ncbi:MAG: hypothetical protein ACP5H3_02080 [Candidatus Aenigmatarchaeota archaeon]
MGRGSAEDVEVVYFVLGLREKGYKVRKQVFGSYNRGFKGNV